MSEMTAAEWGELRRLNPRAPEIIAKMTRWYWEARFKHQREVNRLLTDFSQAIKDAAHHD